MRAGKFYGREYAPIPPPNAIPLYTAASNPAVARVVSTAMRPQMSHPSLDSYKKSRYTFTLFLELFAFSSILNIPSETVLDWNQNY